MKKIIILSFAFALTGFSCKRHHKESNPFPAGEVIPVKVAPVQSVETNNDIVATGLLTTENEANLSFKIGGVIDKVFADEGEVVHKGQLLATLKTTEINSQLDQAKLGYIKARRDYDRANSLYKDSVATLEQLQNSKTALDIAQKTVDLVSFNSEFAAILSPDDGFVTKKMFNAGEVVNAGTPIIAINEVNPRSNWLLKVGVSDKEWAAVKAGQPATIALDAFPGKVFEASVYRKSPVADISSGSFQIDLKIKFSNETPAIGMFGKASIHCGEKLSLIIPYSALIQADGNNAFVFIPIDSNKVRRIPVIIAGFDNNAVLIKSGLGNIRNIIVSNSAFLNERSIITIMK